MKFSITTATPQPMPPPIVEVIISLTTAEARELLLDYGASRAASPTVNKMIEHLKQLCDQGRL